MTESLRLPEDGRALAGTTRLGVSMHAVLQEPSARRQQATLEAAYDAGFRHFDVAPLYGLGKGEERLGRFLEQHPGCTVVTKVGLLPGRVQRMTALAQRPVRAALRAVPRLRTALNRVQAGRVATPAPSEEELRTSVDRSLERLRVGAVDALLTHEVRWDEGWTRTWDSLAGLAARGKVRSFGLDGPAPLLAGYPERVTAGAPVVQYPAFEGRPPTGPGTRHIVWGLLEDAGAVATAARANGDEDTIRRFVGGAGDLRATVLVLAAALQLAEEPDALVLVESSDPRVLEATWSGVETGLGRLPDAAAAAPARAALDRAIGRASQR